MERFFIIGAWGREYGEADNKADARRIYDKYRAIDPETAIYDESGEGSLDQDDGSFDSGGDSLE